MVSLLNEIDIVANVISMGVKEAVTMENVNKPQALYQTAAVRASICVAMYPEKKIK